MRTALTMALALSTNVFPIAASAQTCMDWSDTPRLIGSAPIPSGGGGLDLAVQGDYGYLAGGTSLQVFLLTDSAQWIGTATPGGTPWSVAVSGDVVYVGHSNGLSVYDVSVPQIPVLIGSLAMGTIRSIDVVGSYLYVLETGLHVIDVSDPANPADLGLTIPYYITNIAIDGTRAAMGGQTLNQFGEPVPGFHLVDLTDPAAPDFAGFHVSPDWFEGTYNGFAWSGDRLVASYEYFPCVGVGCLCGHSTVSLQSFDVTDLTQPALLNTTVVGEDIPPTTRQYGDLVLSFGYSGANYVQNVFWIADISNPTSPTVRFRAPGSHYSVAGATSGSVLRAFTAGGTIECWDVTNASFPSATDGHDGQESITHVAVLGPWAFQSFTNTEDYCETSFVTRGLRVYDRVTNPPTEVTSWSEGGWISPTSPLIRDITATSDAVWVTGGVSWLPRPFYRSGLSGNPPTPSAPVQVPFAYSVTSIDAFGGALYLTCAGDGLRIVDPAAPSTEVGSLLGHDARCFEQSGSLGVLIGVGATSGEIGIHTVDVSDPWNPAFLGHATMPGDPTRSWLAMDGSTAAIATPSLTHSFQIVDLSDPSAPRVAGQFTDPGISYYSWPGSISESILYTGSDRSVVAIDLRDPDLPVRIGSVSSDLSGSQALVADGSVYVSDYVVNAVPIDCRALGATDAPDLVTSVDSRLRVSPNPFGSETAIRYATAHAGRVRVDLFDVTGRRVRTLLDAWQAAGDVQTSWDGRDSEGAATPAGVYFVRVTAGGDVSTGKLVRTR
ncbi:MAG: FlgD immunoglobulin-like domain containing protein [bacterium]